MAYQATLNGALGLTDSSLKWLKPEGGSLMIVLPTSAGFVYNPNFEFEEIFKNSKLGKRVLVQRRETQSTPTIQLTFGVKTLSVLALQLGLAWEETVDTETRIIDTLLVKQSSYPAAASGYEGYNVDADADAIASYEISPGISKPLTRQPFATFNASTAESYAIGANNARLFSTDLIGKEVALEVPVELATALKISEKEFTRFELRLNQILKDRTIFQWYWSSVETKLDEGEINDQGETQITFSVTDDGSGCGIPDLTYLGQAQARKC